MRASSLIIISLLLVSCSHKTSVTVGGENDDVLATVEVPQIMPDGSFEDPIHGKEIWFSYGAITGMNGRMANGVGQMSQFKDGTFIHTLQLNIEPAQDGYHYEAWLKQEGNDELIQTGILQNPFGDVRHQLRFESTKDLSKSLFVMVSEEPSDGLPTPDRPIAEGILKVTQR